MEKIREGEDLYDYLCRVEANPRRTTKGWSVRCLHPGHQDKTNSAVVFDDSWHHCFGGCKRFNLRGANYRGTPQKEVYEPKVIRGTVDYFDYWLSLDPLDDGIKGLPARHLNSLGWRKLEDNNILGQKGGVFIPYFTKGRDGIFFYQIRHLEGDRRFSFLNGVTPTANGYESLPAMEKFIPFTEGTSDRAVLEYLGIPTIALPSASSGALLRGLATYARKNGMVPVACSDNDPAGDRLLDSLSGHSTYIDLRAPAPYKDYGEMFEDKGAEAVRAYLKLLLPKEPTPHVAQPQSASQWQTEAELKERNPEAWQILFGK